MVALSYSSWSIPSFKWCDNISSPQASIISLPFSFIFFTPLFFNSLCYCVLLSLFGFHYVFFPFYVLHFRPSSSSKSPYNCVFSLPSRREPSHLLNHLVKFVSSDNLLWVSHHILLKKNIKKVKPIKICNPKINSYHLLNENS